jgi:hypothetical protein
MAALICRTEAQGSTKLLPPAPPQLHITQHSHSVEFSFLLISAGDWNGDDFLIWVKLINRFTYLSINQFNKSIKKEGIIVDT